MFIRFVSESFSTFCGDIYQTAKATLPPINSSPTITAEIIRISFLGDFFGVANGAAAGAANDAEVEEADSLDVIGLVVDSFEAMGVCVSCGASLRAVLAVSSDGGVGLFDGLRVGSLFSGFCGDITFRAPLIYVLS